MDERQHRELRQIFDRLIETPAAQREAAIVAASKGDPEFERRLRGMLAAAEGETAFLASPSAIAGGVDVDRHDEVEGPGTHIGPYKLLQRIGEGGFGSVFMAEQEQPVRRKVALKIIKLGMDTRQVVARFEQERQALAMMDHPNIAKVLDAGATSTGRPYFVMELVRGVPITEYCDQNMLTPEERLALFVPICHAVQHAHQKGIIHRDIKPSNILVTLHDGKPVPKVIDFGIAKATSARLTEKTLFTEHRQLIGTPAYMSPEQAEMSGLDIDTRSDIYSLGVLLYELLTGTTPFDTKELVRAGYAEIQRMIREVDPPKPSTRVGTLGDTATTVASRRRTELARLGTLLRGDLDWIIMKALDKDRTRRYETANGFAADVERHLRGEPVEAAPPSSMYRLRKFVRRRRGLVVAVSAVTLAVVAGSAGTAVGLVQANRALDDARLARDTATAERARAEATAEFLREMLSSIDPEKAKGQDVSVKEILDDAAAKVSRSLADQPEAEAAVRHTLGETYNQLARYRESKEQFARAAEIRARVLGSEHRGTLSDRFGVGIETLQLGDAQAAITILRETHDIQARVLGPQDGDTLQTRSNLGFAMQIAGDEAGALEVYRQTLADQVATLGQGHKTTLETMSSVADVLQDLGQLAEAEKVARELVDIATKAQGADGAQTLGAKSILVSILNDLGRYAEAEQLGREVLATKMRIFGPDHTQTLTTANIVAQTLEQLEKYRDAIAILEKASESAARTLGTEHNTTLTYQANLARNQQLAGDLDSAEASLRRILEVRLRVSGEGDTSTLAVMNNLGLLLLARNKPADAEPIMRRMEAGVAKAVPETHWMRGQAKVNLARSIAAQGRYAEAEPIMVSGYEQLAKALPAGHTRRTIAAEAIAEMYGQWGKPDQQAAWKAKD